MFNVGVTKVGLPLGSKLVEQERFPKRAIHPDPVVRHLLHSLGFTRFELIELTSFPLPICASVVPE
ncbi:hypothetical protein DTL42_14090 [Bremerella cremea]|uniref:Uncharacterized protein n=1 Tax=Bremerella cremea TaxID=1031537 RepID=A0A368KPT4_9BACT|nr:hypothetical protein DTL42_14090 [Bremerella cremea]